MFRLFADNVRARWQERRRAGLAVDVAAALAELMGHKRRERTVRRTSYMRGFVAGELAMAEWIAGRLVEAEADVPEFVKSVEALGPVASVAGLVGKSIGGQDIEPHDYDEWAEDELRDERRRVEFAIEEAMYFGARVRGVGDVDVEERGEQRAFERVPEGLRQGLRFYLDEHVPAGHFLTAIFENDLREALGRADIPSRCGMFDIVSYLHNFAPAPAWGGKRQVELWLTPAIPELEVRTWGPELTYVEGNKSACPGCGGYHLVHNTKAAFGRVSVPEDGHMKAEHIVQFVYCHQVHVHVVGVEGREFES